ncbi:hypothetical protein [Amycolatopsis sacchari]|uniref:Uncharacterized protein n=1 Tax=Amycolatopsis sacchari TaxID=115433 RepID=A0A1I3M3Y5_9PSEU|nr:hypothetical protein [Amycolatopsis sacchari]SFI91426.1 hypothetical protein SAMN05421835_102159 [Amycolatopsis sacchari]
MPFAIALAAYAVPRPDWMGTYRFTTPVWALGALISALAATEVLRQARPRVRTLLAAALVVGMLPSVVSFAGQSQQFRAAPTFPACAVADRYGRTFNAYADLIGARAASLLLTDLGGTSLTSRLHLVDLGGLGDSRIADYIHDNDPAGLRDYDQIFDSPDADGFPGGDWVRKEAAPPLSVRAEPSCGQRFTAGSTEGFENGIRHEVGTDRRRARGDRTPFRVRREQRGGARISCAGERSQGGGAGIGEPTTGDVNCSEHGTAKASSTAGKTATPPSASKPHPAVRDAG